MLAKSEGNTKRSLTNITYCGEIHNSNRRILYTAVTNLHLLCQVLETSYKDCEFYKDLHINQGK